MLARFDELRGFGIGWNLIGFEEFGLLGKISIKITNCPFQRKSRAFSEFVIEVIINRMSLKISGWNEIFAVIIFIIDIIHHAPSSFFVDERIAQIKFIFIGKSVEKSWVKRKLFNQRAVRKPVCVYVHGFLVGKSYEECHACLAVFLGVICV